MTDPATVFMFSGLGSQTYHMGRQLFERNAAFQASMLRLDGLARPLVGHSVLERLYCSTRSPVEPLHGLLDAGAAIYMVEASVAEALKSAGVEPDRVLAVSLGFFAAATLAGCLEPEEALAAVTAQARAVEAHCPAGGMLAVLGPLALHRDPAIAGSCEIAAVNAPSHFVVAADPDGLGRVEQRLREWRVPCHRMSVDYAFHSRGMEAARGPLEGLLAGVPARRARIPIVCCARVAVLWRLTAGCFWTIARQPIRLSETFVLLEGQGASFYVDVGPSGTLAAAAKSALGPQSRSHAAPTMTPFNRDAANLEAVVRSRPRCHVN